MSSEVTLKEIAEALGVSAMTVSRALNNRDNVDDDTRKKVVSKAEEMGYTPNYVAKSLVSNKTFTIGVVIPEITHAFFPEVVRGIEEVTNKSNYQLLLTNANEQFIREKKAVNALRSQRVDGLLISTSIAIDDFSFYKQIIKSGTSVVFFDRCIEGLGASCVSVNDRTSSYQITAHLISEHGYTKIAHLSGPPNVTIGKERMKGYLEALEKYELPINDQWIIEGGFQEDKGYKSMKKLLELSEEKYPEAVVVVNDPAAFGAIKALKDEGLSVPDDMAVVGFTDDIRAPLLHPPLTTVHQPAYNVGQKAAKKLIATIENKDEPAENIEVLTTLKIRASCGCGNF